MATKDLSKDPRFNFGPPAIQTAQDAAVAYLTKVITEDEFRAAISMYGVNEPYTLFHGVDVGAYDIVVPDDLLAAPVQPTMTVQERIDSIQVPTAEAAENEPVPAATTVTSNS